MSSSAIRIPIPVPIPTAMDSVTVTQMALFKPLTLSHRFGRDSSIQLHRRNPVMPLRCSTASSGGGNNDAIVLHVGGMMCEGCAANVKRILESRPQVASASVNLTSEIALVCPVSEEKTAPDWQKQLGEALAQHLTSCGFTSSLRGDSLRPIVVTIDWRGMSVLRWPLHAVEFAHVQSKISNP